MEARRLSQQDLRDAFASKGIASEVINGERAISKTQSKRLAEFFHVRREFVHLSWAAWARVGNILQYRQQQAHDDGRNQVANLKGPGPGASQCYSRCGHVEYGK